MKKSYFIILIIFALSAFIAFTGNDKPGKISHDYSGPVIGTSVNNSAQSETDINPNSSSSNIYYHDNFDAANDTNGLKARGYLVYYRGTGPQGIAPTWIQPGINPPFTAFNGMPASYVAANFEVVTGTNNIDSWLVLPDLDVVQDDIIRFQCRSITNNVFPDSVRVMYNPIGGDTPESPGWIELGRFLASPGGFWQLKSFVAPVDGFFARFAIRYNVAAGGPLGDNSNYIGIDALEVEGQGVLPVELASFVSVVSDNNVTLNWSTSSETNNSGFDIERSDVRGQTSDDWSKIGNVAGLGSSTTGHYYSFTDRNLNSGKYNYRLKQIDFNGNFEYFNLNSEVSVGLPSQFELSQNYPNPFNPTTNLEFGISELGFVSLKVYNASGMEVATLVNEVKPAGYYTVSFNGANLSSGIYFYKLKAGEFVSTKRMLLIK